MKTPAERAWDRYLQKLVLHARTGRIPNAAPEPRKPARGRIATLAVSAMYRQRVARGADL